VSEERLAIIDIGSNSCRLIATRVDSAGCLEILDEVQEQLRLVRGLGPARTLSAEIIQRAIETLRDFKSVAIRSGATRTIALATSAVRDARNGLELVSRIQDELGISVQTISGDREALLAFRGAVQSLPVSDGLLVDIGGGSMELCSFIDRMAVRTWTLPLGALRVSDEFLKSDPPTASDVRRLRNYVGSAIEDAGVPRLEPDEHLVGTGGTIRNLARMDLRARTYPIAGVHGYDLSGRRVEALSDLLIGRKASARAAIPGLNGGRVDSIHGGALTLLTLMESVGATNVQVSGQGLREGAAHAEMTDHVPSAASVRQASLASLVSRFAVVDAESVQRRITMSNEVLRAIEPGPAPETGDILRYAAHVLDIGRSIDYYRRHQHTAAILLAANLPGFSHRDLALVAAVVRHVDEARVRLGAFEPVLGAQDQLAVDRASTILALAAEIERRWPPAMPFDFSVEKRGKDLVLGAPVAPGRWSEDLAPRLRRSVRVRLRLQAQSSPGA